MPDILYPPETLSGDTNGKNDTPMSKLFFPSFSNRFFLFWADVFSC